MSNHKKMKTEGPAYPLSRELIEDVDYYVDECGRWVFTAAYHLKRGYCCENNCKHCPYKKNSL